MCSLAVILRAGHRYPLIVAANRDESRLRPTRAPFLWDTVPRILAGRDERAGGTWMGMNEHGLFAGLTNLHGHGVHDSARGSRGGVMIDVLGARDPGEAAASLARRDPAGTNPFILVCAGDRGEGFWTSSALALEPRPLGDGVHAFGNLLPGDPSHAKEAGALRRIGEAWEGRGGDEPAAIVSALAAALSEHVGGGAPEASLCVHTAGDYGTVSSSIFLVAAGDPEAGRFFHAPGPPCVTPFQDRSELLCELLGDRGGSRPGESRSAR